MATATDVARVASATLAQASEKQEDGVVFTVYVLDVLWEVPAQAGGEAKQQATQVEKRYSEFLNIYWQLRRHQSVYAADFPRRLLWGKMSRSVIEDREHRLGEWMRVVCADDEARSDADFIVWLGGAPSIQGAGDGAAQIQRSALTRDDYAPRADEPRAGGGEDAAVAQIVAQLSAEGLTDVQLLHDLAGVTTDVLLIRDLYAQQKEQPAPALEESCVARQQWTQRWNDQLSELNAKGYTDTQQMAALLEAFAGDQEEACRHYDEMHR